MIKALRTLFGRKRASPPTAATDPLPAPYKQPAMNHIYNLLFCDQLALFAPRAGLQATPWQATLFDPKASPEQVRAIADDTDQESRIRALAYNRLRERAEAVPARIVLGVIVEVPLEQGLDVLAAYADGCARYINQRGKLAVFEGGPPDVAALAKSLVATSASIVNRIGPWDKPRRQPPTTIGSIRMTFLVSDGLYFGEGTFEVMAKDALSGPLVQQATQLLQLAVRASTTAVR